MLLSDGRRILTPRCAEYFTADEAQQTLHSSSGEGKKDALSFTEDVIRAHPHFRMIVLANRYSGSSDIVTFCNAYVLVLGLTVDSL